MKTRLLIGTLCLLAACKSAPEVVEESTPPTVPAEDFQVVSQNLAQVDVKYAGTIAAGSDALTVEKAKWEFVVDGAVKKSGEKALGVSVAPGQTAEFSLEESLPYVKDEEELHQMDARGGSLLLAMRGTLVVSVPVPAVGKQPAGRKTLELPFARSKEVRTPRLPHLKFQDFEAGRFSDTEVQAVFHMGVVNPNPFSISIDGIDYVVTIAGKEVNKGTIGAGERVSNASTGVFDIPGVMNQDTHGKDAAKIVKSAVVPYVLKTTMRSQFHHDDVESKGEIKIKASK